jgi:hypothetical protein
MNSDAKAGVLVITSTGNTYLVADGASFFAQPSLTGDLAPVIVYDTSAGDAEQDQPLAAFGNVEVVYLAGAVTLVTPPATAGKSPFGI